MKRFSRLAAITVLSFAITVLVKADPIDPIFDMGDPGIGLPITSTTFSFGANGSGGGFLQFMNESGADWFGLAVQVTQPTGTIISCSGGPFFSDCLISSIDQGNGSSLFSLNFTSRVKLSGITNGEYFTINLNNLVNGVQPTDPNGTGGWGPSADFNAQVTDSLPSVPEPATWVLLFSGLLITGGVRRLKNRSH